MGRRLVVVGASHAGVAAATAARDAGAYDEVVVVGAEERAPYQRPPLSKEVLTGAAEPAQLGVLDQITLHTGMRARGLDPARRVLVTDAGEVGYDALVIATGARPRTLPALPEALTLRTYDDARGLGAALAGARRVAVVGAGFIGAEVASAVRSRGGAVTLLEQAPLPLAGLVGEDVAQRLLALHAAHGTSVRVGARVIGARRAAGRVTGVELADGELIAADVVVAALGVAPDTGWLAASGIALDADGAVRCDDRLRTSLPHVLAAGDVARVAGHGCGHVLTATEQGRAAGMNAAGADEAWSPRPFAWSQWYGHRLQLVGRLHGLATPALIARDEDGSLLAVAGEADRLLGIFGLDRPRQVAALRRVVGEPGSWERALEQISPAPAPLPA